MMRFHLREPSDIDDSFRAQLAFTLAQNGIALLQAPFLCEHVLRDPWFTAELIFGTIPRMVERQPIRAVSTGKSFASTNIETPLHTDSQFFGGISAQWQLMFCHHADGQGGQSTLFDSYRLLMWAEQHDLGLLKDLFEFPRQQPFVFGTVFGPTFSFRQESLVFTHTPAGRKQKELGAKIEQQIRQLGIEQLHVQKGEILILNNHRFAHGRLAFDDKQRHFTRLLVWPWHILKSPERWTRMAQDAHRYLEIDGLSGLAKEHFAKVPPYDVSMALDIVLAMIRGIPPGVLAKTYALNEAILYQLRDAFFRGGIAELAQCAEVANQTHQALRVWVESFQKEALEPH